MSRRNGGPLPKEYFATRITPAVREQLNVAAKSLEMKPATLAARYIEVGVQAQIAQLLPSDSTSAAGPSHE